MWDSGACTLFATYYVSKLSRILVYKCAANVTRVFRGYLRIKCLKAAKAIYMTLCHESHNCGQATCMRLCALKCHK